MKKRLMYWLDRKEIPNLTRGEKIIKKINDWLNRNDWKNYEVIIYGIIMIFLTLGLVSIILK